MGHRGDATQIAALRDSGPSASAPVNDAPEIGAGVIGGAVALVSGGMVLLRARTRR